MIIRTLSHKLQQALLEMPVVALLGPRQVGKTTLARTLSAKALGKETHYLDLELSSDLARLADAESYLARFAGQLLIIDEVQRKPELFPVLRALVDARKHAGERTAQFLLLGSASRELLQQSSESLAGRIRYLELAPITLAELAINRKAKIDSECLWLRGGYPDSLLAASDAASFRWRNDFIATYIERDLPQLGVGLPAARLRRLWGMLAHHHGQQLNLSALGRSMELSHTSVRNYVDLLADLYMVRQIAPWSGNLGKRLVKSPKVYVRDSGLLHNLLNITDLDTLLGHPQSGSSWEGFVVESIVSALPDGWRYSYYRTATQVELDLVLETPKGKTWAVEIKRSSAPVLSKGFHIACADINAQRKFVVYSGQQRFPLPEATEALSVQGLLDEIQK